MNLSKRIRIDTLNFFIVLLRILCTTKHQNISLSFKGVQEVCRMVKFLLLVISFLVFSRANSYANDETSLQVNEIISIIHEYQHITNEYSINGQVHDPRINEETIRLLSRVSSLLSKTESLAVGNAYASNVRIRFRSLPFSLSQSSGCVNKCIISIENGSAHAGNIHTQLTFFASIVLYNTAMQKNCFSMGVSSRLLTEAHDLYSATIKLMNKLIDSSNTHPMDKFTANTISSLAIHSRVRGELPPSSHRTVRTGPYTALHVNQAR